MTNKSSDRNVPSFDDAPTQPFNKLPKKDPQSPEINAATPMFTEGGTQIVPVL